MTELPAALAALPAEELEDVVYRSSPALWAERRCGLTPAPFHREWYQVLRTRPRLAIVAPREHAKTEVCTVISSAHAAIYWPGIWTYVFGATGDLAAEFKARIDTLVAHVEPDLIARARIRTTMETVFSNGSRVTCAGAGKAVRGAHPDRICGDDVLTEMSTLTEYQRRKMARWWHGTVGGMAHPGVWRFVRGRGRVWFRATQTVLVGTPFHPQDLLMGMRQNPVYHFRRYAAEFAVSQLVPGTWAVEVSGG